MDQKHEYSVPLCKLVDEFELEKVYIPEHYEDILVRTPDINRPGMQLIGFFNRFDNLRLQIMGIIEIMYLRTLPQEERRKIYELLFKHDIPALIICNRMKVDPSCIELAEKYKTPLLRTDRDTSEFMADIITSLNNHLGPRITRHGVMVEVYGEGVLLLGESGIGKSEAAIELVKRGHRLVADDAVEIKRVSYNTLIGSAPEIIRYYVELRGIGVIDVRKLFGMGAVKDREKVDMIINIEPWQDGYMYDRLGLDNTYIDILGVKVPSITVPVKPGRNLAVIIETAAMTNRQKRMGIDSAMEFTQRINSQFDKDIKVKRKDG
ncbi:MAG: HPr(Ser) kinase/phosphatase [Oscillospiraceae bacterium]|nr:HPr(Ser) kinase/phosphatase [Oscillospiraceae bacterium]